MNVAALMALEPVAEDIQVGTLRMVLAVIGSVLVGYGVDWWLLVRRIRAARQVTA